MQYKLVPHWIVIVKPEAFKLVSGAESITDYQWGAKTIHFLFSSYDCSAKGIWTRWGDFYGVQRGQPRPAGMRSARPRRSQRDPEMLGNP
jgi:hypothetical protein